uniref:Putative secreted protein n=1 Tax=Anopheles darlingi TaxID=43151 RepID=A0A2M4DCW8_ANODA
MEVTHRGSSSLRTMLACLLLLTIVRGGGLQGYTRTECSLTKHVCVCTLRLRTCESRRIRSVVGSSDDWKDCCVSVSVEVYWWSLRGRMRQGVPSAQEGSKCGRSEGCCDK